MDRVIPVSAVIDVGPVLDVPGLGIQELDPVGVHRVLLAVVDRDDPGKRCVRRTVRGALAIRPARVAVTIPPYDSPRSYRRDDWDLLGQDVRDHAGIGVGGMVYDARDVHARNLTDDPELQDSTDGRIL